MNSNFRTTLCARAMLFQTWVFLELTFTKGR
jgi:hypothetical protein